MGNCVGCKSCVVCAGDDGDEWESMAASKRPNADKQNTAFSSSGSTREVKIKITKKQLEELLGRVEVHDMPVDQVLSSLINVSEIQHQRSWKPTLQSIPEVE
ncbi:hypothetical protein ACSBR1_015407 [Camellia fascicularis]